MGGVIRPNLVAADLGSEPPAGKVWAISIVPVVDTDGDFTALFCVDWFPMILFFHDELTLDDVRHSLLATTAALQNLFGAFAVATAAVTTVRATATRRGPRSTCSSF